MRLSDAISGQRMEVGQMIRLSDAIVLGSVTSRQIFGYLKDGNGDTCSWGSALSAIGTNIEIGSKFPSAYGIPKEWLWCRETHVVSCLCRRYVVNNVSAMIMHLNDSHRLSCQEIAAWVASIEPREVPAVEAVQEAEFIQVG